MRTKLFLALLLTILLPSVSFADHRFGTGSSFNPQEPASPNYGPNFGSNAAFTLGPYTFSTFVFTGNTYSRVVSLILKDAKAVMKITCNEASRNATVRINGKLRRLRYDPNPLALDLNVGSDGVQFSGAGNVTFTCILR